MIWLLFAVGTLAHAMLVFEHFQIMWNTEHFQFFPVALIAAGNLIYLRGKKIVDSASSPISTHASVALAASCIFLFFSLAIHSSFVAWLSYLFFCMVLVYCSLGWGGVKQSLPILLFLLVIRPLPRFMEQPLTILLQQVASTLASYMLDSADILHYKQGVVLVLAEQSFLAEDACSGIRSLFSSIVAIIFVGIVYRYHWLRHAVNILQTIFWVIVFNAIRIALVIIIEDKTEFSIATGSAHEVAGMVAFVMIFCMVLSTDSLINAIFPLRADGSESTEEDSIITSSVQQFKKVVKQLSLIQWFGSQRNAIAWSIVFGLLAFFAFRLQVREAEGNVIAGPMPAPLQEYLPTELGGWQVEKFEHIIRSDENLQGAESYVWRVRKGSRSALISLDGTFTDYHDLWLCYNALGWSANKERYYTPPDERIAGQPTETNEFSSLECTKKTGEKGYIFFSAVDRHGADVFPPVTLGDGAVEYGIDLLLNSIQFALMIPTATRERFATFTQPVSTIQVVYMPSAEAKQEDLVELKNLFFAARDILRKSPRFQGGT